MTIESVILKLKERYYPATAYEFQYKQLMSMKKGYQQSIQEFTAELFNAILRVNACFRDNSKVTDREIFSAFNNAMTAFIQRELANQGIRTLIPAMQLAERLTYLEHENSQRNPRTSKTQPMKGINRNQSYNHSHDKKQPAKDQQDRQSQQRKGNK